MKISKIVVLHRQGTVDYVWLHTDLPAPFPAMDSAPLVLTFQVPIGTGERYVRDNFKWEPDEVING
jgi:hypothetical protein